MSAAQKRIVPVVIAAAACLAVTLARADSGRLYACTAADGAVTVSSEAVAGQQCEGMGGADTPDAGTADSTLLASGSRAAPVPKDPASTEGGGDGTQAERRKDPRESYRDSMLAGVQRLEGAPATALNPAVTRRYLALSRSAYARASGAAGD